MAPLLGQLGCPSSVHQMHDRLAGLPAQGHVYRDRTVDLDVEVPHQPPDTGTDELTSQRIAVVGEVAEEITGHVEDRPAPGAPHDSRRVREHAVVQQSAVAQAAEGHRRRALQQPPGVAVEQGRAIRGRNPVGLLLLHGPWAHSEETGPEPFHRRRAGQHQPPAAADIRLERGHHGVGHAVLLRRHHHGEVAQPRQQGPFVEDVDAILALGQAEHGPLHRGDVGVPHEIAALRGGPEVMFRMENGDLRDGLAPLAEHPADFDEAAHLPQPLHAPGDELAVAQAGRGLVHLHVAPEGQQHGSLLLQHLDRLHGPRRVVCPCRASSKLHSMMSQGLPRVERKCLATAAVQAPHPGVVTADPVGGHRGFARA